MSMMTGSMCTVQHQQLAGYESDTDLDPWSDERDDEYDTDLGPWFDECDDEYDDGEDVQHQQLEGDVETVGNRLSSDDTDAVGVKTAVIKIILNVNLIFLLYSFTPYIKQNIKNGRLIEPQDIHKI